MHERSDVHYAASTNLRIRSTIVKVADVAGRETELVGAAERGVHCWQCVVRCSSKCAEGKTRAAPLQFALNRADRYYKGEGHADVAACIPYFCICRSSCALIYLGNALSSAICWVGCDALVNAGRNKALVRYINITGVAYNRHVV